ncbi:MAG: U32 family peptidase, partial [Ruthenibacterium sp.]
MLKQPELLCPAGDLERLRFAVRYGADAVYVGGESFGMRTSPKNFTVEQLAEGAS